MIKIIRPIGYCFGVKNAINKVIELRQKNPSKLIFLSRPLVHNDDTNKFLQDTYSIKNIESLKANYPAGSTIIFSAHGLTSEDVNFASQYNLDYLDTTCPFLIKAKKNIIDDLNNGFNVVYVGKKNHPESKFIMDISPDIVFIDTNKIKTYSYIYLEQFGKLSFYPQSTISLNSYNDLVNQVQTKITASYKINNICSECLKRWKQALAICPTVNDVFVIIGDKSSSNSVEFYNLVKEKFSNPVFFISNVEQAENEKRSIKKSNDIFIASSTSSSEELVNKIIKILE